jgi:hypothetical protein
MSSHTRKLVAALILLIYSVCFFIFAIAIAVGILPGKPVYAELLYDFVVCVIWMLPAGWLIRWAQRPSAG